MSSPSHPSKVVVITGASSGSASVGPLDVTDPDAFEAFVAAAEAEHGRVISDGLRQEVGDRIRVTTVSPGVTESELADTISDPSARELMVAYRANAIPAAAIGRAIAYADHEPADVDVNELVIRPVGQI